MCKIHSASYNTKKCSQIKENESNFVYAPYKLIVELEYDAHWIWDAPKDLHGTTMNMLCAERPTSWKTWAKHHPHDGQWSRANVLTHATVLSASGVV
jgi:hypothetical protein